MSSQEVEVEQRVVAVVVIGAILLAVGMALGFGIHKSRAKRAPAPAAAAVVVEEAKVVVEGNVVKFFFATGKADVAPAAAQALANAVAAAQAGKKLSISGYHDATGDANLNAELAKQRAQAVAAVLTAAGVAEAALDLKKPEILTGSGDNTQARRVEVLIVD
jgi:outer membrane protein OmpA-like peptidoglycan-associated protein